MQKNTSANSDGVLNPFVQKHQGDVMGVLRGFDRLRLAGTLRALYHPPSIPFWLRRKLRCVFASWRLCVDSNALSRLNHSAPISGSKSGVLKL